MIKDMVEMILYMLVETNGHSIAHRDLENELISYLEKLDKNLVGAYIMERSIITDRILKALLYDINNQRPRHRLSLKDL